MFELFSEIGTRTGFRLRCLIFLPSIPLLLWIVVWILEFNFEELERKKNLTPSERSMLMVLENIPQGEITEAASQLTARPEIDGLTITHSGSPYFYFTYEKRQNPLWQNSITIGSNHVSVALKRNQNDTTMTKLRSQLSEGPGLILLCILGLALMAFLADIKGNLEILLTEKAMKAESAKVESVSMPVEEPKTNHTKPELKVVNGGLSIALLEREIKSGRLQVIEGGKEDKERAENLLIM